MAQYRRPGGRIFEYDTLPVAGTNRWVASGYLMSDPSIVTRTEPFEAKTRRYTRFYGKGKKNRGCTKRKTLVIVRLELSSSRSDRQSRAQANHLIEVLKKRVSAEMKKYVARR